MDCMDCGNRLIHGGDDNTEDDDEHLIVSNLSCPECGNFYVAYRGLKEEAL